MPPAPKTDFGPFHHVQDWKNVWQETGWWHSFQLPDGTVLRGVCSLDGLRRRIDQFPIPDDLRGKRVLDIGAWDGWYSFEMERRGAEVMAIDCWDNPRFRQIHQILGSRVDYRQHDVYELTPDLIGRFDIVIFFGVLYHLKHPLLALERVCALTTDLAAVDSFVLRDQHRPGEHVNERPIMEFYETDEFGGQTDNWVGPSLPCLMAFCRTAGFARVEWRTTLEHSACIACYRRWEEPEDNGPSPDLLEICHHANFGLNFRSSVDDYVTASFRCGAANLNLDDVKPEVGGFGVRPIAVKRQNGYWDATFKLPPGLTPGWHDVTVRTESGGRSNPRPLAVDLPIVANRIEIRAICDGKTWNQNELDLSKGNVISMWIAGLPDNADINNVRGFLDDRRIPVSFIERANAAQARQVNASIPPSSAGARQVTVSVAGIASAAVPLRVFNE